MKKIFAMLLALAMSTSLVACSGTAENSASDGGNSGDTGEVANEEKVVIGATGLQEDQFTQVLFSGYRAAAEELGVELIIANSQHSNERETEQINNMLQAGAKGIIIECVNPDTSVAIAQTAADAGAAVFSCAIRMNTDIPFASCLNENYDLGASTGSYAVEYFAEHFTKDEEIKMALICYDEQDAAGSSDRVQGFLDALSEYNVNVVARQDGEVADKAYNVATDILTANPDIDVFFCASENGVVGTVNAIEAAGNPNNAVVFGIDCSEQLVDFMKDDNNILQAVTAQDPYAQGTYAVKAVYDYVVNGVEPEEKEYHADCILLTRADPDACDEWLANWNKYAQ